MSTAFSHHVLLPIRQLTPPNDIDDETEDKNNQCPSLSTPRRTRKLPPIPLPEHMLTPPCTPGRSGGPLLLPKIRVQDQILDLSVVRSVSQGAHGSSRAMYPSAAIAPSSHHRVMSLPSLSKQLTAINDNTYRRSARIQLPAISAALPCMPPSPHHVVTPSILFSTYTVEPPTTTLLTYLTTANPSPALVSKNCSTNADIHTTSYWWDVRNLRPWTSFSLSTIHNIPGFTALLNLPIPAPALKTPTRTSGNPGSIEELAAGYSEFYVKKVNSALKVALGAPLLSMLPASLSTSGKSKQGNPDFTTNYAVDHEPRIFHQPRARVVGLVLSFHTWNSGMRKESSGAQTSYLRELARLQGMMRERGCRYGFLITEIELVCVRLGGAAGEGEIPIFGHLELTAPIPLAAHAPADGKPSGQLTACLALWYLNMLSKAVPLPGEPSWKLEVGGPAAVTRKKCVERDPWMGRPEGREKREAKRRRGWVWPSEPLSRRELGGGRVRGGKVL